MSKPLKSVPPTKKPVGTRVPCGIVEIIGGHEWICVAPVHDTEKQKSSRVDARGYTARSERHLMVRRWPGTDR